MLPAGLPQGRTGPCSRCVAVGRTAKCAAAAAAGTRRAPGTSTASARPPTAREDPTPVPRTGRRRRWGRPAPTTGSAARTAPRGSRPPGGSGVAALHPSKLTRYGSQGFATGTTRAARARPAPSRNRSVPGGPAHPEEPGDEDDRARQEHDGPRAGRRLVRRERRVQILPGRPRGKRSPRRRPPGGAPRRRRRTDRRAPTAPDRSARRRGTTATAPRPPRAAADGTYRMRT